MPDVILRAADGSEHRVTLRPAPDSDDGRYVATFDDSKTIVRVLGDRQSGRIEIDGRVFPFVADSEGNSVQLWIAGRTYTFDVQTASRANGGRQSATTAIASGDVAAPMPGTIQKILVKKGDGVASNQPLIVMESMKMEMTLAAPRAGNVTMIDCREGQLVEMGAILVRIEDSDHVVRPA